MVTDRTKCVGCPHYTIVSTLNHPEGTMSCRFAIKPCDTCRQFCDCKSNPEIANEVEG